MQLHRAAAAAVLTLISLFLLPAAAHNITDILKKSPEFSIFNRYLTQTGLAAEINRRTTITVLAVNNASMDVLTSKNYGIGTVKNLLSFLVLLDYYDAKKLHQITDGSAVITSLYQTTGLARGADGAVNITILSQGKVGFWPDGEQSANATFVKEVRQIPYNISVIQISGILYSPEAEAPAPDPAPANLTASMSGGCKLFAETLAAETLAQAAFDGNIQSGLTILCPGDAAMRDFLPRYKNLSEVQKQSLLEYHGVPMHLTMQDLGSSNGKKMMTLATHEGKSDYEIEVQGDGDKNVTIRNKIVTASVVGTLSGSSWSQQPVAIYQLDKVLLPVELFNKSAPVPAPGPGPASGPKGAPRPSPVPVGSPSPSSGQISPPAPPPPETETETPAPGPDGEEADSNGAARFKIGGFGALVFSVFLCYL